MNIILPNKLVLLEIVTPETETGIIMPDTYVQAFPLCRVVKKGELVTNKFYDEGDLVVINHFSAQTPTIRGKKYYMIDENQVLAVVKKGENNDTAEA